MMYILSSALYIQYRITFALQPQNLCISKFIFLFLYIHNKFGTFVMMCILSLNQVKRRYWLKFQCIVLHHLIRSLSNARRPPHMGQGTRILFMHIGLLKILLKDWCILGCALLLQHMAALGGGSIYSFNHPHFHPLTSHQNHSMSV